MKANALLRPGTTLMEIAVIMAATGLLMMASLRLLSQAGQLHAISVRTVTQIRVADSAATRLRHDIGQAVEAQASDGQALILVNAQSQKVRYSVQRKSYLRREILDGDQVLGRDDWDFGSSLTMQVTLEAAAKSDSPQSDKAESADGPSAEQLEFTLVTVELVREVDKVTEAPTLKVVNRIGSRRSVQSSSERERP